MIPYPKIILLVLLIMMVSTTAAKQYDRCVAIKDDVFDHCGTPNPNISFTYLLSKQVQGDVKPSVKGVEEVCLNERVCRKVFKITYLRRQLYTVNIFHYFKDALGSCCGDCSGYRIVNTIYRLNQITKKILNDSDIVFPLLGTKSTNQLYGFHYVPVLEVPSSYYFTLRETQRESMEKLILGVLGTWPLLVIALLLALLSGVLIWFCERKDNSEEFPKSGLKGFWEGFWWGFVSMTTVGYGDKTPRSVKGRIFAILWILIGITIFGILVGSLTNQIENIHNHPTPMLLGQRVGGLSGKFHESTMVAQHGGTFIATDFTDTIHGIVKLIGKLERKEIDGFLISRASWYWFNIVIGKTKDAISRGEKGKYGDLVEIVDRVKMDETEKDYIGEKLKLGFLVKDIESYHYLKAFYEDNWLQIQNCNSFKLSKRAITYSSDLADHFGGLFFPFLYAITAAWFLICCWALFKYLLKQYSRSEKPTVESQHMNGLQMSDVKKV